MNHTVKNILAVLAGVIAGGVLNMGIIMISGSIIPPPEGVDVTTAEGLQAGIHLFEPKHFIMPFLAHALGTLLGSFIAAKISTKHPMRFALGVGAWNLFGGIMAATMIPAPMWFILVDLIGAYIPMAFIAGKLATKNKAL
ncbi:MAG: hypothetical protein C0448_06185 [Sphingobacteriaceae bacterium]|nr:hypothetical protein [Sphingobacteriaceae bacterium]